MKRLTCVLLVLGLGLPAPSLAWAAPEEVTPESTSAARFDVEQAGQRMVASGDLQAAADLYWSKGFELRDPVLLVMSAEALRDLADRDRSIPAAEAAIERLRVAFDMLYYLRDSATSASWQPITSEQVSTVLDRAERVASEAEALISAIEEAAKAPVVDPDEGKRKRGKAKPGTVLIAAGAGLLVLGLGGGGLGAGGLAIGAAAQQDVEDPLVYAVEHHAAEERGQRGNVLAGVGFSIAGVGVIAGSVLIVLGVKKRKGASPAEQAFVPAPIWLRGGAGLGVSGRF